MQFHNVCIESLGYVIPDEVITTDELETRLEPVYQRLRLPAGRLELITGIRERRFWAPGTMPSDKSIESCRHAMEAADIDSSVIGALIHASVCRDHLEPATACRVHDELGLSERCFVYDVSNACLGLLNAAVQVAQMIELGQIRAGLVVGTESSRQLVETTITALNADQQLTRSTVKPAVASLTIGSGSCALLLVDRELSKSGNVLSAAVARADTKHHRLCHSGADEAVGDGMSPLMQTDSEALLNAGIDSGRKCFEQLLAASDWNHDDVHKTICHQVGKTHRKQMLESLGLPVERDFATVEWLGNTGSVALPISLALAAQYGHIQASDHVGLLGIGSGINSVMLGAQWHRSRVQGGGQVPFDGTMVDSCRNSPVSTS